MTIFRSFDDGRTWPADAHTLVYSGVGGYSCMTKVPGDEAESKLGLLWETNTSLCVGPSCLQVFTAIPVAAFAH